MKKSHYYQLGVALVASLAFISAPAFAASTPSQSWDPTLTQAKSCAEVESVFKEYFSTNWYGGYFGPLRGGVMMNDAPTKEAVNSAAGMGGGAGGDFSATNTQKTGVDESDIIKNDGKYIYYADGQQAHKIYIVSAATNGKEESTITLPSDVRNTQLYLSKGKLIVIGGKSNPYISYQSSMIARDQKAMVIVYDVSNPKAPKLMNAYEYDGYIQESRLVDNRLVLVTSQGFTWGPVYMMRDKAMSSTTTQTIKPEDFTFKARDLLPTWTSMKPTTITRNGVQTVRTAKSTTQVDCTNVLYKKPDAKGQNAPMWGYSLTSIITMPLDAPNAAPSIKTILGSSSQVHVTRNSLYVTAPSYVATQMSCPINARCLSPIWAQGNYTTIHQFSLPTLGYNYSTAVKGTTYSQYNMDDTNGTFRIVTSDRENAVNKTNVYTVSSQGKVLGKLENIAPNEQSHGVRFIGDYVYLVTYRQIDPLFVINLSNPAKPAIVGELKMPGYSTYLHPYGAMQGNIQYLIGLGYNTSVDANGNERQGGIKIDMYKADFSKKDAKGNVAVTQAWTQTLGEQGSQTEALYNPRMFVFNSNTKELLLPIVIAKTEKTQQCNIVYGRDGSELRKECYPQETAVTQFAGLKGWTVSPESLKETVSIDYKDSLKNPYNYGYTSMSGTIDPWIFSSIMARVGYMGNKYYFITSQFAHLFQTTNLKGVRVDFPFNVQQPESSVTPLKAKG